MAWLVHAAVADLPWLCGVGRLDSSCDGGVLGSRDQAEHPQGAVAALAVMEDLQIVKDGIGEPAAGGADGGGGRLRPGVAAAVAVIASLSEQLVVWRSRSPRRS